MLDERTTKDGSIVVCKIKEDGKSVDDIRLITTLYLLALDVGCITFPEYMETLTLPNHGDVID